MYGVFRVSFEDGRFCDVICNDVVDAYNLAQEQHGLKVATVEPVTEKSVGPLNERNDA